MHNIEASTYSEEIDGPDAGKTKLSRGSAWLLLMFCGILWGSTFSLAKIATEGGGHPLGITYWQSLIGVILLLLICAVTRKRIPRGRNNILFYIACGLLGSIIPGVVFYYAASRVSPGILSITIAMIPILTFLAAAILRIEKMQIMRLVGVVCGAISIIMLVGPEESLPDPSATIWIFASLFAAACYAAENLTVAVFIPKGASPITVATGLFLAAAAIMTPIVFITDTFVPMHWPMADAEMAIIALAFISVTAYSTFIYLVAHTGAVFSSQTAYVVTFSGVLWGMLIFGETHSVWIWASLAMMIVALILVTPRKNDTESAIKS